MADEFDLIKTYFVPLAGPEGLGLVDDAACLKPRAGFDLVITKDVLVSGVHFFENDPADTIAHKALAVNLSDLAAKGAQPKYYLLGLSLPQNIQASWLTSFASGLQQLQEHSGCYLVGGDTTASSSESIIISVTAIGEVVENTMLRRSGAEEGDDVYVTGTLGDAALGLAIQKGSLNLKDEFLLARYLKPTARTKMGQDLVGIANATADISDGLIADLGHICIASNVGAEINSNLIPVSFSAQKLLNRYPDKRGLIWSGGDDYELIFTAPPTVCGEIQKKSSDFNVLITRIGHIKAGNGVKLLDEDGNMIVIEKAGFKHF